MYEITVDNTVVFATNTLARATKLKDMFEEKCPGQSVTLTERAFNENSGNKPRKRAMGSTVQHPIPGQRILQIQTPYS